MSEWRTIDSAPRDFFAFDAWVRVTKNGEHDRSYRVVNVRWDHDFRDGANFIDEFGNGIEHVTEDKDRDGTTWTTEVKLSHWMPLPPPPDTGAAE